MSTDARLLFAIWVAVVLALIVGATCQSRDNATKRDICHQSLGRQPTPADSLRFILATDCDFRLLR